MHIFHRLLLARSLLLFFCCCCCSCYFAIFIYINNDGFLFRCRYLYTYMFRSFVRSFIHRYCFHCNLYCSHRYWFGFETLSFKSVFYRLLFLNLYTLARWYKMYWLVMVSHRFQLFSQRFSTHPPFRFVRLLLQCVIAEEGMRGKKRTHTLWTLNIEHNSKCNEIAKTISNVLIYTTQYKDIDRHTDTLGTTLQKKFDLNE